MTKVRSNYEPSEDQGIDFRHKNKKTGEMEFHPGMTKQAEKEACDINNILRRYEATGVLPDMIRQNPQYGDYSAVPTYQEALDTVIKAQEQFEALPAGIRERFLNDPAKMLEFVADPKNGDEMIKLGMRLPKEEQKAVQTKSTNEEEKKS